MRAADIIIGYSSGARGLSIIPAARAPYARPDRLCLQSSSFTSFAAADLRQRIRQLQHCMHVQLLIYRCMGGNHVTLCRPAAASWRLVARNLAITNTTRSASSKHCRNAIRLRSSTSDDLVVPPSPASC